MTGTVKALVWNPFRAETPFGYYNIDDQTDRSADELKGRPPFLLTGSRLGLSRHPTLADAKAAAQADYERRVLSALTASASEPAGPVPYPMPIKCRIEERDDDMLIVASHWNYGKTCVARRPKLMTNDEWRPLAERIVAALAIPVPASEPEPVAWEVTLLMGREDEDGGDYWETSIATNPEFVKTLDPVRNKVRPLVYANPVPTDGAVEALRWIEARLYGSPVNLASEIKERIRETLWQKPGRAAQAWAGEKPDFPADEQSGETSHGAVTDALERYRAQEPFGGDMVSNPQGTWVRFDDAMAKIAALSHPADGWREDTARLDALRDNSWDLRCFDIATGGDDYDIGWRVIGHWQAKPQERVVGEVYNDDPRAAIDAARSPAAKPEGE